MRLLALVFCGLLTLAQGAPAAQVTSGDRQVLNRSRTRGERSCTCREGFPPRPHTGEGTGRRAEA